MTTCLNAGAGLTGICQLQAVYCQGCVESAKKVADAMIRRRDEKIASMVLRLDEARRLMTKYGVHSDACNANHDTPCVCPLSCKWADFKEKPKCERVSPPDGRDWCLTHDLPFGECSEKRNDEICACRHDKNQHVKTQDGRRNECLASDSLGRPICTCAVFMEQV